MNSEMTTSENTEGKKKSRVIVKKRQVFIKEYIFGFEILLTLSGL